MLTSAPFVVLVIISALTLGLANTGIVNSQNSSTALEHAQKSLQAKEDEIVGKFSSIGFRATNMSLINKGYGTYEIIGFLKNIGNERYGYVTLVATLFDKSNNLIGVEEGIPVMEANVAEPMSVSAFRIPILSDVTNLHHYLVEVTVTDPF